MARGTGPPPPSWGGLGSSGSHGRGSPDAGAPQEPPRAGQGGETWLRTRQGKAAESRRGRKPRRGLFGKPLSQLDAAAREQPAEPTCEVPACPAPREMLPARQMPAGLSPRGADAARAVPAPGAAAPPQPQGAERHRGSAEPRGAAEPTGGAQGEAFGQKGCWHCWAGGSAALLEAREGTGVGREGKLGSVRCRCLCWSCSPRAMGLCQKQVPNIRGLTPKAPGEPRADVGATEAAAPAQEDAAPSI